MRFLIADDDFTSRKVLQSILQDYGSCDIAVNGLEAFEACITAYEVGNPYDLICLDIMMPEMDGQEALIKIRDYEDNMGITSGKFSKVMMTTAIGDFENIVNAFDEQCEAYVVKPLDMKKVITALAKLELL